MTAHDRGFDGVERRGLMFVLSSPSGAGKTTLLKAILGLVKPDSLRTNCKAEARISSSRAGGAKLNKVRILRHIAAFLLLSANIGCRGGRRS